MSELAGVRCPNCLSPITPMGRWVVRFTYDFGGGSFSTWIRTCSWNCAALLDPIVNITDRQVSRRTIEQFAEHEGESEYDLRFSGL